MIIRAQSGQLYQLKAHLETGDVAFNHDNEDEPETDGNNVKLRQTKLGTSY